MFISYILRLVLNTLMWVSFSWSCVIDPENGPKVCKSIANFLTFWEEDAGVRTGSRLLRNRNEAEKIRFCIRFSALVLDLFICILFWDFTLLDIMMRTHRFFNMFSYNTEFREQHIDGMHFITGLYHYKKSTQRFVFSFLYEKLTKSQSHFCKCGRKSTTMAPHQLDTPRGVRFIQPKTKLWNTRIY
jgi:hypothetical protein